LIEQQIYRTSMRIYGMPVPVPIPVDKCCKLCGERKLLSDFEFSNDKKNRRVNTCKTCMEKEDAPYGGCCQDHFQELAIVNTFDQLESILEVVEAIQYNMKIPHELLQKMSKIVHKGKVRCDSCDGKDRTRKEKD
jgi:hypothetical protein